MKSRQRKFGCSTSKYQLAVNAWRKIIWAFMLGATMLWGTGNIAQAASLADGVNLVMGFSGSEELVYASPGVCVNSDGKLAVFTSRYDSSMQAEFVGVQTEEQVCLLEYSDDVNPLQGYYMGLWIIQEDSLSDVNSQDSAFMQIGYPYQNEEVTAVFYDISGDDVIKETKDVVLRDMSEDGELTVDGYPIDVLYPAALVNGKGELVGMLLDDGVCIAAAGNQETFYGAGSGSTSSTGTATAAPLPPRESGTVVAVENVNSMETLSDIVHLFLIIGAIVVVAAIVIIVIVVILAGKKKQGAMPAPKPEISAKNVTPVRVISSQVTKEEQPRKLWLMAKGGCMNGRVYPVEQNEITIGRDAAMVIRFPADTPGVSRIHAKLYWQGDQLMLMDCNSTSGTFLKRLGKLTPMAPVAVQSGDVFYIGEKANSFEINTGR